MENERRDARQQIQNQQRLCRVLCAQVSQDVPSTRRILSHAAFSRRPVVHSEQSRVSQKSGGQRDCCVVLRRHGNGDRNVCFWSMKFSRHLTRPNPDPRGLFSNTTSQMVISNTRQVTSLNKKTDSENKPGAGQQVCGTTTTRAKTTT
jgi:hypothetical protein